MTPQETIWCDGEFIPANTLTISPFDLGLTVGWGVFETLVAYQGEVFCFADHWYRAEASAGELGIALPAMEDIQQAIPELIQRNDLSDTRARIRFTVTGGENPLIGGDQMGKAIITAISQRAPADHATLIMSQLVQSESVGLKVTSYAHHVAALRAAIAAGADEAIVSNPRGELCECAMANLFIVQSGEVHTPPLESGCLSGVTRAVVLALCESLSIPAYETILHEADLSSADEIFITNTAREVQPASLLGNPMERGKITSQLQQAYQTLLIS
ncbi:MAG: aminotransferase class IV [Akkermansiaceae bacterium]